MATSSLAFAAGPTPKTPVTSSGRQVKPVASPPSKDLARAESLYKNSQFAAAAEIYFKLAYQTAGFTQAERAKFGFAMALRKLGLNQVASFPLVSLVHSSQKIRPVVLVQLAQAAAALNDASALKFALGQTAVENLDRQGQELVLQQLGDIESSAQNYEKAVELYRRVLVLNPQSLEALYSLGLSQTLQGSLEDAEKTFQKLFDLVANRAPNDPQKVQARLALARVAYDQKNFAKAIDQYRAIPKDSRSYRQSLLELSWSLFRSGRFRSALAALQTLHTPFYDNFYDAESLLLRGIILLFICEYEEVEKVFQTFSVHNARIYEQAKQWAAQNPSDDVAYNEVFRGLQILRQIRSGGKPEFTGQLPFPLLRSFFDADPLRSQIGYLRRLEKELTAFNGAFQNSKNKALLDYGRLALKKRHARAEVKIARQMKKSLNQSLEDMVQVASQFDFLHVEALGGLKSVALAGGANTRATVDVQYDRMEYLSAGYRYWPFEGEFWRDEIGNYQFLGVNRCGK